MFLDDVKDSQLVVQHNHMVNARFSMTPNEMRLFVFMLSEIKKKDTQFRTVEVPVELFRNRRGNILYQDIKNAADRITQRRIAIQNTQGSLNFRFIPLMALCAYQEGTGTVKARFNDEVKPYLLQLGGNFTASQLKQLLQLKSFYAHRMYWLLKQYEDFGSRTIALDELKAIMELSDKYKRYIDFRMRVIDRAQDELQETDMAFHYEEQRKGKSVHSIRFVLLKPSRGKGKLARPIEQPEPEQHPPEVSETGQGEGKKVPVLTILKRYGFSDRQVRNILKHVSEQDIYKTNYAIQCEKGKVPKGSLTGYAYAQFQKRFLLND